MPLVIIQWVHTWRYMVETKGYTLEEIAIAFDGSTAALVPDMPIAEEGLSDFKGADQEGAK